MDYEKKYKEALERAKAVLEIAANKEEAEGYVSTIFPELKEPEDEKIKKEIISFIQDDIDEINLKVSGDYDDRDEDDIAHQNWCKKAIAWLENIPYTIDHEKREGFHLGYKAGLEKQGETVWSEETDDDAWLNDIISKVESGCTLNSSEIKWLKSIKDKINIHYWTEEEIEPIISDYLRGAEHYGGMIARLRCLKPKSLEKQGEPQDKGEISDGYHTFNELYYYRMLYNAAFFNMLPKEWVCKSKRHNDGEECFGGGWFIVMANLPTGQISNHYELKDWDLFQIPEKEVADKWDGHTPQKAADRLHKYLLEKQDEQKQEINNFDVLPGLYKCVHRMFDGTPDGRLLFEVGNVYRCLSKHDRAEFEVSYGHSVYLEDPVVCKHFIPFEKQGEVESDNDDIEVEEKGIREAFNKIEDEKQCKQKPQRMISAEAKEAMYNKPANTVEPKCEESKTKIFDTPTPFEDKLYAFVLACEILVDPSKREFILEHSQEILDAAREQIGKEQKPAWSIKEKLMLNDIIETTERSNIFKENYQRELIDWLKSLKTRYTWKPSDEQMKALENAIRYGEEEIIGILSLLYNDLKKLREDKL